jgi:hypothetical protein
MSYAYGDRVVWVTDLEPDAHPMTHDLCDEHASTIAPPRGWELRDERLRRDGTLFAGQSFHHQVA